MIKAALYKFGRPLPPASTVDKAALGKIEQLCKEGKPDLALGVLPPGERLSDRLRKVLGRTVARPPAISSRPDPEDPREMAALF